MDLVGKDLAAQVPANASGHQARYMYGAMTEALAGAYNVLGEYQDGRAAVGVVVPIAAVDAGAVDAARRYLDSVNAMLATYYGHVSASDEVMSSQQLAELRASVSASSVAVKTVDDLFGTSFLEELVDEIVKAAATITAKVAKAAAKALGSTLGALWWLVLPSAIVAAIVIARKHG